MSVRVWLLALALLLGIPSAATADPSLSDVRADLADLEDRAELMTLSVNRFEAWQSCLRGVPVTELGDPDRQFGFVYDERDGSGPHFMPALAVDRRRRNPDYVFLDFKRGGDCRSAAPLPGGTAEPASAGIDALERRVVRLRRTARRLEAASERFDAWESCVSWVPVTEYGDPDGGFGFAFAAPGAPAFAYRPALSIDRSDWDDPDYMILALVGDDRPGRECQNEPGEAVD
jgi:hypothetical protein